MATQPAPTVFLSYTHADKRVARRLVRRMTAHGIRVWLDERELRLGAALTAAVRTHIQGADFLLVVASQASATAKWVGLELNFAQGHGKAVIPFFIEAVAKHARFRDHLGIEATNPQAFADAVHRLMRELFSSVELELPPPDPARLEAGLRELAGEEPDLSPLILGCLDGEGLRIESVDTVFRVAFHPLDEALNALVDLRPTEAMASLAATGFCAAGAGARALFSWVAVSGDGGLPLVSALGGVPLAPAFVPTALLLLGACAPPNNHALYQFIHRHAALLDPEQRRSVLRLVTWPERADTGRLADVLGWVALKHFPDSDELAQMWCRWIYAGSFDGTPSSPHDLGRYLADAHRAGLPAAERIDMALRNHVRGYLRSGDKQKIVHAMDYVCGAADAGAPVLALLLRETEGVAATAEWHEWEQRDPETAAWMQWYVFEYSREAVGDRNWLRAWDEAKRMVAFEEQRRRILAKGRAKQP